MEQVKRDYYEVLGVGRDADPEEIKSAFRSLARKLHPDVSPEGAANDTFSEIAEAYSVLSKPAARLLYDRYGYLGRGNFRRIRGDGTADSDDFHVVAAAEVEVEALQAEQGTTRRVRVTTTETCGVCRGRGASRGAGSEVCGTCRGERWLRRSSDMGGGRLLQLEPCPDCAATGQVVRDPCSACGGTGRTETERKLKVRIPPGAQDAAIIRVAGRGNGRGDAASGDVYVALRVVPDGDPRVVRYAAGAALALALVLFAFLLLSPESLIGQL